MGYGVWEVYGLCYAFPCPPTWWTQNAMDKRGYGFAEVWVKRGSTVDEQVSILSPICLLGLVAGHWSVSDSIKHDVVLSPILTQIYLIIIFSFFNVSVFSYVDLFWYLVQYVHSILLRHFIPDFTWGIPQSLKMPPPLNCEVCVPRPLPCCPSMTLNSSACW